MKTNEILTSGLLELYAMGQATKDECSLVETHLHLQEIREELNQIEQTLFEVTLALAKPVPSIVKNNLDALLFPTLEIKSKIIQLNSVSSDQVTSKNNWWAIAASGLLLFSLGTNFFQLINYAEIKNELAELERTNTAMAGEIQVVKQDNSLYATVHDFFKSGDVRSVNLNAVNNKQGNALVYVSMETGRVAINSKGLPQIDNQYQYQLWALVDGKPVDLGLIPNETLGKEQITLLKEIKGMQAFAITKEVFGGKPTPNLEELVVLGNV